MIEPLPGSAERVRAALSAADLKLEVKVFPASSRTSLEAAAAISCPVAAIAKSLIFRAAPSGRSVLIVASGANRVDEKKVAALICEKIERADADFVRDKTGFAIGGVPPVAHLEAPLALLDEDLLALPEIWAAAGTPNAVFRLTPDVLARLTGARFCDLKKT